jgi:ATP-binding cassette subfamily F protein uup
VAYFDQLREQLDDNKTVFDTVAGGNDHVIVNGNSKHVISYLKDFLFTPARSRSDVRVLSGGERNRLLLAKLFTQPANVLALDEPTNDLDAETLEILESMVVDFPGTILLISHDRVFLDHVATSTIAFEGAYGINEYVGGYNDWLRQRPEPPVEEKKSAKLKNRLTPKERGRKLSYKEHKELNRLPAKIDHLEAEQQVLHETLANPASYQNGTDIPDLNARLETMTADLETAYARWEELEAIRLDAVNKR